MRLLNWLKKDSKSAKRRQSAPLPLQAAQGEFDPDATRNTKYIQDLERFNSYRQQMLENSKRASIGTNTSGELVPLDIDLPRFDSMSQVSSDRNGKAGNRLSLPVGSYSHDVASPNGRPSTSSSKSKNRKDRRNTAKKLHESSIMEEGGQDDEIRLFEQQHCLSAVGAIELSGDEYTHSPPTRFYKKNETPYHERLFAKTPTGAEVPMDKPSPLAAIDYATPQRRNNAPFKPSRRKKRDAPVAPIPKIRNSLNCSKAKGTETDSMSEPSHFNGSYKNYEINSSSMYDECVISSKGYKGNMPKPTHNYQHVVNKHGDVVEYAMPLLDEEKVQPAAVVNKSPAKNNGHFLDDSRVIDENFKFLADKCNLNFSDSIAKFVFNEPSAGPANPNVQITDLDKSEMEKNDYQHRRDIFNELDALGRWAESIEPKTTEDLLEEKFNLNEFLFRNDTILISYPKEIEYRTSVLRNSINMPVELTSGIFWHSNVSVRKHQAKDTKGAHYSQEALRKDFSILKKVRHADIITLMAVVADRSVNQMQLVMEPFDFSLNYYIHCQNNEFSLDNVVIVMQQMAQAVSFLQEHGYIHSNISSHSVLMRQHPFCVKLGFFELATEINSRSRREILSNYGNMMDNSGQDFNSIPDYSLLLRGTDKYVKEKYQKLSKNINLNKVNQAPHRPAGDSLNVPSKYLPYYLDYRQQFSLYFYQAPELLSTRSKFVLPNTLSDVYSLSLLMWELLNNCVPYVIYSYSELEKLYKTNQALLPRIQPARCEGFETILKMGLEKDPVHRVMSIKDFMAILDDLKTTLPNQYDVVKKAEPVDLADLIQDSEPLPAVPKDMTKVNEMITPKLAEKAPFAFRKDPLPKNNHYENLMVDPQMRMENAIINNISMETFDTKSTTTCADYSVAFTEASKDLHMEEPDRRTVQRTNGELSGGLLKGFTPKPLRRNSMGRRTIAKKLSPTQCKNAVKRSAENLFNLSQSTIFNSVSDVAKLERSPQDKDVVTSTLKRKKNNIFQSQSTKPKSRLNLEDQLREMDKGLNLHKEDQLEEFKNSPKPTVSSKEFQKHTQSAEPRVNPHKGMVARARALYMKRLMYNNENGQGDNVLSNLHTPNNRVLRGVPNSAPAAYKLSAAMQNRPRPSQLLKHAWLSDQKLDESGPKQMDVEMSKSTDDMLNRSFTIETQVADELKARNILSVEKVYKNPNASSCNISLDESFKEKNVNVNLKIIHNNLEIFNNSLTSPGDLSQKIQKIQLGMYEKDGCDPASVKKPEIKIRLTPGKNASVLLNDLNEPDQPIGKQITDLTSEIRSYVWHDNYDTADDKNAKRKLLNDLTTTETPQQLQSPKLVQGTAQVNDQQSESGARFENALWHKEKSICEKSSGCLEEEASDWISVPMAIQRFENISKSMTESPKPNNKSTVSNSSELNIVKQSRLPSGGVEGTPVTTRKHGNAEPEPAENTPVATSSPLIEDSIRRFNSFLRPVQLVNVQPPRRSLGGRDICCSSRNLVRRATFNEGPGQANRSRRITTKVTFNLKKTQPIASFNTSELSDVTHGERNDSIICANCGTNMNKDTTNANISTSMISYSTLSRANDKPRECLHRRSSSCSTLRDDDYWDEDFKDPGFLTPNIRLVKNDHITLFAD